MNSLKSVAFFLSGIVAGIGITLVCVGHVNPAWALPKAQPPFKDVPSTHAAAAAVEKMKSTGIMTGYDDDAFHGSQPVTRYELAVVLARFAQYYDTSKAPLASTDVPLSAAPIWVQPSRLYLASNGFVPYWSPLFRAPGTALITADLLSDTVSSTVDRLIDRSMPLDHP
jgi:hypothetical protein